MSILQEIKEYKLDFVKNQKSKISLSTVMENCKLLGTDDSNKFSRKLLNMIIKRIWSQGISFFS